MIIFSIIIPAYNEEKYLPACLQSLKEQTLEDKQYEIIVIDNGSTDKTQAIAEEFGVTLIIDETSNVSGLRNKGARISKGKVLAFIDADCTASKDWLSTATKYIDEKTVVAWGAPPSVPENATWVQKSWYNLRKKTEPVVEVDWLESMNLFVRKDSFFSINGFNEELITCEDVDFSYRISEHGKIISDNTIQVVHYGEAKDIKQFIKKEYWRGISNYQGVFSHGFKFSELGSLMMPVYFGVFIPVLLIVSAFSNEKLINILTVVAVLLPVIAVLYKLINKKLGILELVKLLFLVYLYFIVRTVSAFKGLITEIDG